jgi:hypothetical protein
MIVVLALVALFCVTCGYGLGRLVRASAPHEHRWLPVAITSHSPPMSAVSGAVPVTIVLRRCEADGELATITLNGTWTLGDLTGAGLAAAAA